MGFEEDIKQWIKLDNETKKYNESLSLLRKNKKELQSSIWYYANNNNLQHAVIQISDGNLKFQNTKITQTLTLKFINECLCECIEDKSHVESIMQHIKDKRNVSYINSIKRSYT
jgi:hypothetical protein